MLSGDVMSAGAPAVEDNGGDLTTARVGTANDNNTGTFHKEAALDLGEQPTLGLVIQKGSAQIEKSGHVMVD